MGVAELLAVQIHLDQATDQLSKAGVLAGQLDEGNGVDALERFTLNDDTGAVGVLVDQLASTIAGVGLEEELLRLFSQERPDAFGVEVQPVGPQPCDHLVMLYEHEQELIDSLVEYFAPVLHAGQPAIAVATAGHLAALERELVDRGLDVAGARRAGLFVGIDAHRLLDRISVKGRPDPAQFHVALEELFDAAAGFSGCPWVFGEMVAVLWGRGQVSEALELEDLWNDLLGTESFGLLCAYPTRSFDSVQDADAFLMVCAQHSSVLAGPGIAPTTPTDDEIVGHGTSLQQAAVCGHERLVMRRQQAELQEELQQVRDRDRRRRESVARAVDHIRGCAEAVSENLGRLTSGPELDQEEIDRLQDQVCQNARIIEALADDVLVDDVVGDRRRREAHHRVGVRPR